MKNTRTMLCFAFLTEFIRKASIILIMLLFIFAYGHAPILHRENEISSLSLPTSVQLSNALPTGSTLTGEGGQAGYSVSGAGDVNNDGYDDFIIGAYAYSSNAGRAYLVYGGPSLSSGIALGSLGSGVVTLTGESGSQAGWSVSGAGDVNNDGYDDFIIGAYAYSSNAGRAYLVYGGPSLSSSIALGSLGSGGVTLTGESSSLAGYSVSGAGDVNNDGYDDFIIGAWGYSSGTGRAYLVYGGPSLSSSIALGSLGSGGVTLTGESSSAAGVSVSGAGDVNKDGYDDFIIGADRYSSWAGRAFLVYGGLSLSSSIALGSLGSGVVTLTGESSSSQAGKSVSGAGDVNNDGYDDFIIGAYGYSSNVGRAYLVYGGPSLSSSIALGSLGTEGVILTGEGGQAGYSVSGAGDVNNDGYDDFIIGAYAYSSNAGRAYLVYGGPSLSSSIALGSLGSGGVTLTGESSSLAGYSVSGAGDVNKDGCDDFIIGASGYESNTGRSYILASKCSYPTGQPTSQPSMQPSSQPSSEPTGQPTSQPSSRPSSQPSRRSTGQPTSQPSMQPSSQPSRQRTGQPTSQPSMQPSSQPSRQPTGQPTSQPSMQPSSQPSSDPTGQPTSQPSMQPSSQPSSDPTGQPTSQPSMQPSSQPSRQPTGQPTSQPSMQPSSQPSSDPTGQPTSQPSMQPSSQPSRQPTGQPTSQPSMQPSSQPSSDPTGQPTSQPSSRPSSQPSRQPTGQPTSQPSMQPSSQPSSDPTGQPTSQPSMQPSSQPSRQPTGQPTSQPSMQPSSQPSRQPTGQPTSQPSMQPSSQPSRQPTGQPTSQPSMQPSSQPSRQPTGQPTSQPSMQPSSQPSRQPTGQPTSQPSMQPSSQPSSEPTGQPTSQPSMQPSSQPSSEPTGQPTSQPSSRPSSQPSRRSTGQPTSQPSMQPSSQPSRQRTGQPTSQPSMQPSSQPSRQPTGQPTSQPSMQPSSQPSSDPTGQPTSQPSMQPSSQPSGDPTGQPTSQPSMQPSSQPSRQPTGQPTSQPSMQPSSQPSSDPTGQPTSQPSMQPSSQPSRQPTGQPTSQPSMQPSSQPSSDPTGQPTSQPSSRPSSQPSRQPTGQPTSQPSMQPSSQPSSDPTGQPTSQPSMQPSSQPSRQPTGQPTSQPSMQPSSQPSRQPTGQPTSQPSMQPSSQPSRQPTGQPTSQPSMQPSSQPSRQPTGQPTSQPSMQPSSQPSRQPTGQPTSQPSMQPSSQPSSDPTGQPTSQPSSRPSSQPSRQPTGQPTSQPSMQPSSQPSSDPTGQPTSQPSMQPSSQPSRQPTGQPTSQPSMQPSSQPSRQPTGQPTSQPSMQPSSQPSRQPTGQPTSQPSMQPSSQPSRQPTGQPTSQPSMQPSSQPSRQPTGQPTSQPSMQPSSQPSSEPTGQPTSQPSMQPSSQPSRQPTGQPTSQPSMQPSSQPSRQSTGQPTSQPSMQPSSQPSRQPTGQPTSQPSMQPSSQPSRQPTGQPTSQPSMQPSSQPSRQPTGQPTSQPSMQPSSQLSRQPTGQPTSQPSMQSSSQPSSDPTGQPTSQPSMQPSSQPSSEPTGQPTSQPSSRPSSQPSRQPTGQPTSQPSMHPSSQPSSQPTGQPTSQPSMQPHMLLIPYPKSTFPSSTSFLPSSLNSFYLSVPNESTWRLSLSLFGISYVRDVSETFSLLTISDPNLGNGCLLLGHRELRKRNLIDISDPLSHTPVVKTSPAYRRDTVSRSAVIPGDINQDGFHDLLLCSPLPQSSSGLSACYLVFGANEGISNPPEGINSTIYGERKGDFFGFAIAGAGDINRDSSSDLIICALNKYCLVLYGRKQWSDSLFVSSMTAVDGYKISADSTITLMGVAVAGLGDMNGDGYPDLAISTQTIRAVAESVVFVIYGRVSNNNNPELQLSLSMKSWEGFRILGESGYFTGLSIAGIGDVNQDGYADLAIGKIPAPNANDPASFSAKFQSTILIFGSNRSSSAAATDLSLPRDVDVEVKGGGFLVSGPGDLNGNGIPDVLLTAVEDDYTRASNAYIVTYPSQVSSPPTFWPSSSPSSRPSSQPSASPSSSRPTNTPTERVITGSPSLSLSPTSKNATFSPSYLPTMRPTKKPQTTPTRKPSTAPTIRTTAYPTVRPSLTLTLAIPPSTKLTARPTPNPSKKPTPSPSRASPTSQPSSHPTIAHPKITVITKPGDYRGLSGREIFEIQISGEVKIMRGVKGGKEFRFHPPPAAASSSLVSNAVSTNASSAAVAASSLRSNAMTNETSVIAMTTRITIIDFHLEEDRLDLRGFPSIHQLEDMTATDHPLSLHLNQDYRIILYLSDDSTAGSRTSIQSYQLLKSINVTYEKSDGEETGSAFESNGSSENTQVVDSLSDPSIISMIAFIALVAGCMCFGSRHKSTIMRDIDEDYRSLTNSNSGHHQPSPEDPVLSPTPRQDSHPSPRNIDPGRDRPNTENISGESSALQSLSLEEQLFSAESLSQNREKPLTIDPDSDHYMIDMSDEEEGNEEYDADSELLNYLNDLFFTNNNMNHNHQKDDESHQSSSSLFTNNNMNHNHQKDDESHQSSSSHLPKDCEMDSYCSHREEYEYDIEAAEHYLISLLVPSPNQTSNQSHHDRDNLRAQAFVDFHGLSSDDGSQNIDLERGDQNENRSDLNNDAITY